MTSAKDWKKGVVAALLCMAPASAMPPAAGPQHDYWMVYVVEAPGTSTMMSLIDAKTVTATGPSTRASYEELYFAPYAANRKIIFYMEYDCAKPRHRMLGVRSGARDKAQPNLHPVWERTKPEPEHDGVIAAFVCGNEETRLKNFHRAGTATPDEYVALAFRRAANGPSLRTLPHNFGDPQQTPRPDAARALGR
jgi:hypothetical protein